MRIRRAKYAGACYGVKRALRLVNEAISDSPEPVFTLGPLIHNPQVVESLRLAGAVAVDYIDQVDHGTIVIRSHGVGPRTIDDARQKGLKVLDATCPHVSQAQIAARDLHQAGYLVVVVGEQGHPEVEGISAYSGDQVVVVLDASELPVFSPNTKIGIVAQTTQTAEAFNAIVDAVKALGIDPLVHDTVCNASRQRQEAALELAAEVDVMLVIGGRNSSNTTRLAELCARVCERTFHVEKPAELDPAWFNGASSIGLSAGASTPESQLVEFEQELERYFSREQCL